MIKKPQFHPVLQTLVFMALMMLIKKALPGAMVNSSWLGTAAIIFLGLGLILGFLGGGLLERSRTTTDPLQPEQSNVLVTGGIYRYTRNPMYLGFLCVLIACGFYIKSPASFLVLPLYVWSMTTFQIKAEEQALAQRFDEAYRDYQAKVRRWI